MEKEQDVKFKKQFYNDKLAELQREKDEFKREKEVF